MMNSRDFSINSFGTNRLFLLLPVLALLMRVSDPVTANFSFVLLAFSALLGLPQAIQALFLSWFFSILNEGIQPLPESASITRYLVVSCSMFSVFLHGCPVLDWRSAGPVAVVSFMFGLAVIVHSLLFSMIPDVSILKVSSWLAVIVTLLLAWDMLDKRKRETLFLQLYYALVFLSVASIPLYFSVLGFLRYPGYHFFQGILNHPQAFGLMTASLSILAFGRIVASPKPLFSDLLILPVAVALMYLTKARVAGFSFLAAMMSAGLLVVLFTRRSAKFVVPGLFSKRVHQYALTMVSLGIIFWPNVSSTARGYISKQSTSSDIIGKIIDSRGILVNPMLENIQRHPLTGIGFGISTNPNKPMVVVRESYFGLPVSATAEKGVMPIAVLEELGAFGFAVFAVLVGVMIRQGLTAGFPAFSMLMLIIWTNMAELTFFSPGGSGLLLLILLAWAVTRDRSGDGPDGSRSGQQGGGA